MLRPASLPIVFALSSCSTRMRFPNAGLKNAATNLHPKATQGKQKHSFPELMGPYSRAPRWTTDRVSPQYVLCNLTKKFGLVKPRVLSRGEDLHWREPPRGWNVAGERRVRDDPRKRKKPRSGRWSDA